METNPEKLALLYERFRDICLVEKELYMPREVHRGPILTAAQDRYEVVIDDPAVEEAIEANIPLGAKSLGAAIEAYRAHIRFVRKG